MSSAVELRTWLNRPENDFCTNLAFGIKAWRSIEFVLITKQEIITEEFCRQLPALRKQLRRADSPRTVDEAWTVICEFLALRYASGAIGTTVKQQLVDALRTESRKSLSAAHPRILDALLLTVHNTAMQNLYKSQPATLADLCGSIFAYARALVQQQSGAESANVWLRSAAEPLTKLLTALLTFVKQTPLLEDFRRQFAVAAFVPFAELIITLGRHSLHYRDEFHAIVREQFCPAAAPATALLAYFRDPSSGSDFGDMFAAPAHAFALWLETLLIAFRQDAETQSALHRHLFAGPFNVDAGADAGEQLARITHYMHLLKRHDASMTARCSGTPNASAPNVKSFLGQHVEALFERHHRQRLADVLGLLQAAIRLDPMMLEHSALRLAVRCMVQPKTGALAAERFADVLSMIVNVYRRLSRANKLVAHLMRILVEQLADTRLSSKLKRKSRQPDDTTDDRPPNDDFEWLRTECAERPATVALAAPASDDDWPDIRFAWPERVGQTFVAFVGTLVSRASISVWKTILFALTDYVLLLKEGNDDANTLFLVDMCAALFCQYFAGVRLAEHSVQLWPEIQQMRSLTHSLLQEFGEALLSQPHSDRTMNAFLRCCRSAGDFELVCLYYWPDSLERPAADGGLWPDGGQVQWPLVEQRISNFGRDECKANLNRVYMQRMYGQALLRRPDGRHVGLVALDERPQVVRLLGGAAAALLVARLTPLEVRELCAVLLGDSGEPLRVSAGVLRCRRFVCALYAHAYQRLCVLFGSKATAAIGLDCDGWLAAAVDGTDAEAFGRRLAERVLAFAAASVRLKRADVPALLNVLRLLRDLPVDFVGPVARGLLFVLQASIFVAARKANSTELLAASVALLRRFVHFGETPELFAVLRIADWVALFGCSADLRPLYRVAFERVSAGQAIATSTERMFGELLQMLDGDRSSDELLDIAMLLVEQLSKEKRCKDQFAKYRSHLLGWICRHIEQTNRDDAQADRSFVGRTVTGFAIVVASTISRPDEADRIDGAVRTAFGVYLRYASVAGQFGAIVKLLNLAQAHRTVLGLQEDEIREQSLRFWSEYVDVLKSGSGDADGHAEAFLRTVLNSKTPEEFVDLLDERADGADELDAFVAYRHKLFANIGRCQLTKVKGSMFNELFKQLSLRLVSSIRARGDCRSQRDAIQKLLECQRIVCANVQLPLSVETVDDILTFLSEIDVKSLAGSVSSTGDDFAQFVRLHTAIAEVGYALVQHRHFFVVGRVAQFGSIVRQLLTAIAFVRIRDAKNSAGGASEPLDNGQIAKLADLSHRMENIVKSFVKHAKDVKRIAPYLLLCTINLLVSEDQSTMYLAKIKTHFDAICFDLIAICDHRVESFVLRNCNEAAKQVYDQLNSDFNKYHKFKGKV